MRDQTTTAPQDLFRPPELSHLGSPIVVFNKSHSGSRLLATLLEEAGVFLGANLNISKDSLDVLRLVEELVTDYYPDYSPLWDDRSSNYVGLKNLIRETFDRHLEGFTANGQAQWGWKLCETNYILPVVDFLFPNAKFIHLIRDGRDVAFCDHRQPDTAFWKKVYFNTDRLEAWNGLRLTKEDYVARPHIYNAMHWCNSVTIGRSYGAMLRERCLEVRYEDLCLDFQKTANRVLAFCGLENRDGFLDRFSSTVRTASVGKYKSEPPEKLAEILEIESPLLLSLGYDLDEAPTGKSRLWRRLFGRSHPR